MSVRLLLQTHSLSLSPSLTSFPLFFAPQTVDLRGARTLGALICDSAAGHHMVCYIAAHGWNGIFAGNSFMHTTREI